MESRKKGTQDSRLTTCERRLENVEINNNIPKFKYGFWCTDYSQPDYSGCCFMHWVGLPKRWSKRHPLYTWQKILLNDLEAGVRYIYILKPPKIGATEFFLRYALFKTFTDKTWNQGQVMIIVGTNLGESELMIQRTKDLLALKDKDGRFVLNEKAEKIYRVNIKENYNNKKEFFVNSVRIAVAPAMNYDVLRSKANMKMIIGDEVAFFLKRVNSQQAIRDAFEHYKGASDVIVALITTAGEQPGGFAYDIYQENPSMYKKYILGPEAGLEVDPTSQTSLYDPDEIKQLEGTPSYKRNFLHQWGYDTGNIFTPEQIDNCLKPFNYEALELTCFHFMGIDWGFSTSKFAFTVGRLKDNTVQIIYNIEFDKPDFDAMVRHTTELQSRYHISKIFIDGSNPAYIRAVKKALGERQDYQAVIEQARHDKLNYESFMHVIPVSFSTENKTMLSHAQQLVSQGKVLIPEHFKTLLQQMRAGKTLLSGSLDKDSDANLTYDSLDSLFLCLRGVAYKPK